MAMEATIDFFNNNNIRHNGKEIARLKSSLTLDIDCGRSTGNGIDLSFSGRLEDGVLSTPDVGLLKLATPELERLVLQQYLQQLQDQTTDVTLEQRQAQLVSNEGRLPFPANFGEVSKSNSVSASVELRRSADQRHNGRAIDLQQQQHDSHIVGSMLELGACSGDNGSVTAASSSSFVRHLCNAIDVSANAWQRDFYNQSSMATSVSDHERCTPSTGLQFSPSSSSVGTSGATPPPVKVEWQGGGAMVKSGDRLPVSTSVSFCGRSAADDVDCWQPSKSKRPCYHKFDDDEIDTASSVSGSLTTMAAGVETPPISPINMADQERIKLERKRARNRMAATRCRNRKLERIATLQDQADRLRSTNAQLAAEVSRLRNTVYQLRRDVARHSAAGCQPLGATAMLPAAALPLLQHQQPGFMLNATVGANGQCFQPVL